MARVNTFVDPTFVNHYSGAGTRYEVIANNGSIYVVYIDINSDVVYKKSTDGGETFAAAVSISGNVSAVNIAVWYDRWSGLSTDLIHVVYTETGGDETRYRTIDTGSSDTLSTVTVVFNGASTANGGALSVTRSRGGNVYCKTCIDAGAEGGFFKLLNANVPSGAWEAALTDTEALATTDQWILVPGFAADNNDIMCIFYDASALGLSRYVYDDSANSWAESAIIADGSITLPVATTSYPHFSAAVDLTNSQILVVAWNAVDGANQDLLGFTVTESAITAFTTTPVLNATDDCGMAGIAIDTDTNDWHVFYFGKADGSETWNSIVTLNRKISTDDGATWGAETAVTDLAGHLVNGMFVCPRFATRSAVSWLISNDTRPPIILSIDEPAVAAGVASNMFGGGVVQ